MNIKIRVLCLSWSRALKNNLELLETTLKQQLAKDVKENEQILT